MNTTEYYNKSIKLQEEANDLLDWIKATLLVIAAVLGAILGALWH